MIEKISKNENIANFSEQEKQSFLKLFKTIVLINGEDFDIELSLENKKSISEAIQREFLDIEHAARLRAIGMILDMKKVISDSLNMLNSLDYGKKDRDLNEVGTEKVVKLEEDNRAIVLSNYYGWGFTPRLSIEKSDIDMPQNCLGNAIQLGSILKDRGEKILFAAGVDHPLVCGIDQDGEILEYLYFNGEEARAQKLEGRSENMSGVRVFKLDAKRGGDPQSMFYIFDFDDAVLYETLENLKVLREMSLGHVVSNLPNTKVEGMKIAEKYKVELQALDIDRIQKKLFPDIYNFFMENQVMINKEQVEVHTERIFILAGDVMSKVTEAAIRHISGLDNFIDNESHLYSFEEGIYIEAEEFSESIIKFLYKGEDLSENIPERVRFYFTYLKNAIEGYDLEQDTLLEVESILFISIAKKLLNEN